jgi:hypothetical protein
MKHNSNKQRHRGGRPQGKRNGFGFNPLNRSFDSSGPDIKVRGNAYQVYEKYQQLARDANAAGDRVAAENFLQHAEHYYRILNHDGQWYQRQLQQQAQAQQQQAQGMNPQGPMQGQGQGQGQGGQPQPHQHLHNAYTQPMHGGPSPQLNQPSMGHHPNQGMPGTGGGGDMPQDDYQEPDLNNP